MKIFSFIKRQTLTFRQSTQGLALIEFALVLPLLLLLLFGTLEVCRYLLISQKLEKTIYTVTDVLTQAQPGQISATDLQQYLAAANVLMNPFALGASGLVILTGVETGTDPTKPTISWQACGGGTLTQTSTVGSHIGSAANLPAGFTMTANEEVVVGEIYFYYIPLTIQNIIPPTTLYRYTVFKPRLGSLTSTSSCP